MLVLTRKKRNAPREIQLTVILTTSSTWIELVMKKDIYGQNQELNETNLVRIYLKIY
jgi:hypothetical protein